MAVLPATPDFTGAAERTAASEKAATDAQTLANRPNQTDPYGNKSTWTQDPATGQWTQSTSLSGANQGLYDQQQRIQGGLLGQAANTLGKPMDMSGLQGMSNYDPSKLQSVNPGALNQGVGAMGQLGATGPMGSLQGNYGAQGLLGNAGAMGALRGNYGAMGDLSKAGAGTFNMDAIGNSKAIQDATYKLLSPQRQMERSSEIQRLKNQGLTEDSPAFQRAVQRLDQGDTQAQLQSLLAGQTEYGNAFNRGLGANQSNFGQRVTAADFANQSNQQRYSQDMGQAQFGSQNQQQKFNQNMAGANLTDQQRAQRVAEDQFRAQFGSSNQQQQFSQNMQRANLADSQNAQKFGQNLQQQQLAQALRGQQFGEQGAMNQQNLTNRNQQIGEREDARNRPLNDLKGLMGASSFQKPEFSSFANAGNAGGTDYTTAITNEYDTNLKNTNAQNATSDAKKNQWLDMFGNLAGNVSGDDLSKWYDKIFG